MYATVSAAIVIYVWSTLELCEAMRRTILTSASDSGLLIVKVVSIRMAMAETRSWIEL